MEIPHGVWDAFGAFVVAILAWLVPAPRSNTKRTRHDD